MRININKIEEILRAKGQQRKALVKSFQKDVWELKNVEPSPSTEILSDLAYDLDFYEPDETLRGQDQSFYDDARLDVELMAAIEKLQKLVS